MANYKATVTVTIEADDGSESTIRSDTKYVGGNLSYSIPRTLVADLNILAAKVIDTACTAAGARTGNAS